MTDTLDVTRALADESDDRYHRQSLISWWDQERIASARALIIGAGALGNELVKNLALTGVGQLLIVDMDTIEGSNLSRTALFDTADEGQLKASTLARAAMAKNPDVRAFGLNGHLVRDVGLGVFAWADLVFCGVDNREARVFTSRACALTGRVHVDGAIEGLSGIVRVLDPSVGPCYACTMNGVDRKILAERRSCAMLAQKAHSGGLVPTTAAAASVIAGLQVAEGLKLLHGQSTLCGEGLHLIGATSELSRVRYPRRPDCPDHDRYHRVERLGRSTRDITLDELLTRAERELGHGACLELSRDLVVALDCAECERRTKTGAVLGALNASDAACPECGKPRALELISTVSRDGGVDLSRTPNGIGVVDFDFVGTRRGLDVGTAWLFDGDAAAQLGPLDWREA